MEAILHSAEHYGLIVEVATNDEVPTGRKVFSGEHQAVLTGDGGIIPLGDEPAALVEQVGVGEAAPVGSGDVELCAIRHLHMSCIGEGDLVKLYAVSGLLFGV